MAEFILAWVSGPWAPLLVVALFVALGLLTALGVAVHDTIEWLAGRRS